MASFGLRSWPPEMLLCRSSAVGWSCMGRGEQEAPGRVWMTRQPSNPRGGLPALEAEILEVWWIPEGRLPAVRATTGHTAAQRGHPRSFGLGGEDREASLPAASGRPRILDQQRTQAGRLLGAATTCTRRRGRTPRHWHRQTLMRKEREPWLCEAATLPSTPGTAVPTPGPPFPGTQAVAR